MSAYFLLSFQWYTSWAKRKDYYKSSIHIDCGINIDGTTSYTIVILIWYFDLVIQENNFFMNTPK
jgi:hypothetical protein